jgi:hypothetical protein
MRKTTTMKISSRSLHCPSQLPMGMLCSTAVHRESWSSCKDNISCNKIYIIKTLDDHLVLALKLGVTHSKFLLQFLSTNLVGTHKTPIPCANMSSKCIK